MSVKTKVIQVSFLDLAIAITFVSLTFTSSALAQLDKPQAFTTQMSGGEEVPSVSTTATGTAEFNLGSGGIDYQVSVTGVSNVTSISIHSGNVGENGPVIVTLFRPNASSADLGNDVEAGGTITASDLEGPMQGKEISDLVSAMSSGVTYVNVLTQANPDGEIRGQN